MSLPLPDLPFGLGHVLYIGPGRGALLEDCVAGGARSVWMVEADPAALEPLQHRAAEARVPAYAVAGAAVARPHRQTALLHRFQPAGASSLLQPAAGLRWLYPGLAPVDDCTVEARPIAALAAEIPEAGTGGPENLLLLDVPGQSATLMEALRQAGELSRFGSIVIREASFTLYEGGCEQASALDLLERVGYATGASTGDPDLPLIVARAGTGLSARRAARLEELAAFAREPAAREAAARVRIEELEQAQTALAAQDDKRLKELEAARVRIEELEQAQTALASDKRRETETRVKAGMTELRRAEGQIELIRDLLLKGPEL